MHALQGMLAAMGAAGAGYGYGAGGGGHGPDSFQASFRCYSMSMKEGKESAETGGKILLPASALEKMSQMDLVYPLLFELQNAEQPDRKSHCGVLEFSAEEGRMYVPYWMMRNLCVSQGALVRLRTATLPKGEYVKLQPESKAFIEIQNPRAVLERVLRDFCALGAGQSICITYNDTEYWLNVLEVRPLHPSKAISIVETDVNVDFAAPLDYVEPEPTAGAGAGAGAAAAGAAAATGGSEGAGGAGASAAIPLTGSRQVRVHADSDSESDDDGAAAVSGSSAGGTMTASGTFRAFSGSGNTVRGRPPPRAGSSPASSSSSAAAAAAAAASASPSAARTTATPAGGDRSSTRKLGVVATSDDEEDSDDGDAAASKKAKFVPFGGTGHSLRG